jgi:hypothetical protein
MIKGGSRVIGPWVIVAIKRIQDRLFDRTKACT